MAGRIIIICGPSSGGKSTLVEKIRTNFPDRLCAYSTDLLWENKFMPLRHTISGGVETDTEVFCKGFHRSIAGFAEAGNDMIVEMVLESHHLADDLGAVLRDYRTLWIWASAPRDIRLQREEARKDREPGMTDRHDQSHGYRHWDLEIDTTEPEAEIVFRITQAWLAKGSA